MKDAQGLGEPHPFTLICLRKLQSRDCRLGTQDSEPVPTELGDTAYIKNGFMF